MTPDELTYLSKWLSEKKRYRFILHHRAEILSVDLSAHKCQRLCYTVERQRFANA